MLGRSRAALGLGLIIPHYWGNLFCVLYVPRSHDSCSLPVWLLGTDTYWPCVECLTLLPFILCVIFSLFQVASSHACDMISTEEALCRSWFALSAVLWFSVLLTLWGPCPCSQFMESVSLHLYFPSCTSAWKFAQVSKFGHL